MRELPSRGRCHAAFLLAYSARIRTCSDREEWIAAAGDKPTHMAGALDIAGTAALLVELSLVDVGDRVVAAPELRRLDRVADTTTLKGIARLLLMCRPPAWIPSALAGGRLAVEFIPAVDLETISWLGEDLEPMLVAVHAALFGTVDDQLRKALGDAGELAIMSALRRQRGRQRHVALISDRYGYDVENHFNGRIERIEVKSSVTGTSSRIFVSRNEFDVASKFPDTWRLIQVVFSARVIPRRFAAAEDILGIREMSSPVLRALAPNDTDTFKWLESAQFMPRTDSWTASGLKVEDDFEVRLPA